MSFSIYDASAPIFVSSLSNMRAWLDKALSEKTEAELLEARLAPDMRPLPAQFQMASDSAKNAIARLAGIEAPAMADTESSFAELQDRCDRTIAFIESIDPSALAGARIGTSRCASRMAPAIGSTERHILPVSRCRTSFSTSPPPMRSFALPAFPSASRISCGISVRPT
jgi:hypothetical protein